MFFNVYSYFFYHEEHEVQEDIRDLNFVPIMTFMVNERILILSDLHYFYTGFVCSVICARPLSMI